MFEQPDYLEIARQALEENRSDREPQPVLPMEPASPAPALPTCPACRQPHLTDNELEAVLAYREFVAAAAVWSQHRRSCPVCAGAVSVADKHCPAGEELHRRELDLLLASLRPRWRMLAAAGVPAPETELPAT